MRKTLIIFLCSIGMSAAALDPNHFTINRVSAPYFVVDGNSPATLTKAYVGFEVKNNSNSGVTYSNLKFTITSIGTSVSGQNYTLVSPANGIINVGTLAPGQTKVCFYYVQYPAHTTAQATFNVTLSDLTVSSKSTSFVIYNRSSISANAGGSATQTFTNQDIIGGLVYDDVTYAVGNVQNGDESDFQVAVSPQFDPTKILLLGTQVTASTVPGIAVGSTDSLYYITGNGSSGSSITVRWTFRISGSNFTTYLLPCAGATSGATNYKYALNTNFGQGSPITVSSAANPLLITKTSDHLFYATNASAIFTITITNPGLFGVTIDKVTDQLPTGFTFSSISASSQVTSTNSTSTPSAGATGSISFEGGVSISGNNSYYIPANGGSILIRYTANAPSSPASNLLTTTRDYVGTTEVGSATNTVSVTNTLPVTLLSFNASWLNTSAKLDWTTTNEMNCRLIEVERSGSSNDFTKIGEIVPTGSLSSTQSYSFLDANPLPNLDKYRLKFIDLDGHSRYSTVLALYSKINSQSTLKTYPAPFREELNLQFIVPRNEKVQVSLYDMCGKKLLSREWNCIKGVNSIVINEVKDLPAGAYCIRIEGDNELISEKLLK